MADKPRKLVRSFKRAPGEIKTPEDLPPGFSLVAIPDHPDFKDLTGQTFGRWFVVGFAGKQWRNKTWVCWCECGSVAIVYGANLQRGRGGSRSCGCLQRELAADLARKTKRKHGQCQPGRQSPEHKAWVGMWQRCRNPSAQGYHRYGGRGITVCDRWKTFENFFADMGPRPSPDHSIGRKENDGNYEPGNCRWETREEQARNMLRHTLPAHEKQLRRVARNAVNYAVRRGKLHKPTECPCCGGKPVQAHHHNGYRHEHRLDVVWRCITCHRKEERNPREQAA